MAETKKEKKPSSDPPVEGASYWRRAIDHPDKYDSVGKADAGEVPRTTDPNAIERLRISVVDPDNRLGRNVQGEILFVSRDDFKPYACDMNIYMTGGWIADNDNPEATQPSEETKEKVPAYA